MSEIENSGDKTLTAPTSKTLHLKPRTVEQGLVRQSFSHGRSKVVVVEKVKRRAAGGGTEAKAQPAPTPAPTPAQEHGAEHLQERRQRDDRNEQRDQSKHEEQRESQPGQDAAADDQPLAGESIESFGLILGWVDLLAASEGLEDAGPDCESVPVGDSHSLHPGKEGLDLLRPGEACPRTSLWHRIETDKFSLPGWADPG